MVFRNPYHLLFRMPLSQCLGNVTLNFIIAFTLEMQLDVPQELLRYSEKFLFIETLFGKVCLETGNFTKISLVLFKELPQILS